MFAPNETTRRSAVRLYRPHTSIAVVNIPHCQHTSLESGRLIHRRSVKNRSSLRQLDLL